MRAVLDTNIIISALFWRGAPLEVYVMAGTRFTNLTSTALLAELQSVLERPKFAPLLDRQGETAQEVLEIYARKSKMVTPIAISEAMLRDPNDRIVLECALGGEASYIVSGDKDLLTLQHYNHIPILNASEFLDILGSETP